MEALAYVFSGSDIFIEGPEAIRAGVDPATIMDVRPTSQRDFEWAGLPRVAIGLDEKGVAAAIVRGMHRLPIRQALSLWPTEELRPALKALALLNWLEGTKYCGKCGAPLVAAPVTATVTGAPFAAAVATAPVGAAPAATAPVGAAPDEDENSALVCPSCGRAHFPRISPAVIVLVKKEGKALLARNARFPPGGRFGLLAGFVEAGETLEEAAAREVREESGIEIDSLRYVASQPWPFPDSLMLAFTAEWVAGEARPDGREIAELRWCRPEELPDIPPKGSVARRLIDDFCRMRG